MIFKVINNSKNVIDKIMFILQKNNLKKCEATTCTVNGYQTENIIKLFNNDILKKILPIDNLHKKIFHIHYIKYNSNGYQAEHCHETTEKYSFILYLNDSDGDTVFKEPINKKITPKLGKLIFFDSSILHRGEISNKGKEILVGAVDKNV